MAKRKIVWSHRAKIKLYQILEFYIERNKSSSYSKKLYLKVRKEASLLVKHPEIGIKTEFDSVRGLIVENYILFYEYSPELIIIHSVWDCRQNPDHLTIK